MQRIVTAALVALVLLFAGRVPASAAARSDLDARVDALTTRQLLTTSPARLVNAGRQTRARKIADLRHAASAGWALMQIIAFWWLWRSGNAARLRDVMRRRTRSRTVQRAVFGAVLGALAPIVALPFALISYRVVFNAGLTDEHLPQWFLEYGVRILLDALLGAIIVAGVLALVEKLRIWYLIVAGLILAGAVASVTLAPVIPFSMPMKTTPNALIAMAAPLEARIGVAGTPVIMLASSRHSNALNARAAGIGPTSRALIGDVVLDHMTPPEQRVVLADTLAHVRFGDPMRQTLLAVALFVLSAAIAVLLSDRVGFRRDDDALSRLALVGTFLGLVLLVTYPAYNAYARNLATRSDEVGLIATGDRAATVRAMVRYADDDLVPLCDRRSIRWYFDDGPALGGRIAATAGTADPCPGGGPATTASP